MLYLGRELNINVLIILKIGENYFDMSKSLFHPNIILLSENTEIEAPIHSNLTNRNIQNRNSYTTS